MLTTCFLPSVVSLGRHTDYIPRGNSSLQFALYPYWSTFPGNMICPHFSFTFLVSHGVGALQEWWPTTGFSTSSAVMTDPATFLPSKFTTRKLTPGHCSSLRWRSVVATQASALSIDQFDDNLAEFLRRFVIKAVKGATHTSCCIVYSDNGLDVVLLKLSHILIVF